MIEMFKEWYDARHNYAREWKKKNPDGKVIGYFCTYVPEEILYAANVLPVRILGSHEPQDVTEPHIFGMYCPFCRDTLAQGLKGRYDYLDGIMIAQSCLHIRQTFTSWQLHVPTGFSYYLPMPHNVQSKFATPFLKSELESFKASFEKWLGKKISDEDLDKGIEIMNKSRMLAAYDAEVASAAAMGAKDIELHNKRRVEKLRALLDQATDNLDRATNDRMAKDEKAAELLAQMHRNPNGKEGGVKYDVYTDQDMHVLFSKGVTREFGENKIVTLNNESHPFMASVQPLKCEPKESGLFVIGTIEAL